MTVRFYGKYRGTVVNDADPMMRAACRWRCPRCSAPGA